MVGQLAVRTILPTNNASVSRPAEKHEPQKNPQPAQETTRTSAPKVSIPAPKSLPSSSSGTSGNDKTMTVEPEAVPAMAQPKPQASTPEDTQSIVSPKPLWRVQVGHFASREEAERELTRIREIIPSAFVVQDGAYHIQAGAFGDQTRADALSSELARHGLQAKVIKPGLSF